MGESIPHITMAGAEALLKFDVSKARDNARRIYSPIYDTLPPQAQDALLYMAYQMGAAGLSKFVGLKQSILAGKWDQAAWECVYSWKYNPRTKERTVVYTAWYNQTPTRARFCASLFLSCLPAKTIQQGIEK
jgi:GH24 family phage-related lysozyme (muramidase)